MPPFYGREQVIGNALQGLFGGIQYGQQRRDEKAERERLAKRQEAADARLAAQDARAAALDAERQKEQRVASLIFQRAQGIEEGSVPKTPTFQIGAAGDPMLPGDNLNAGRYEDFGDGLRLDTTKTPEAKARAAANLAKMDADAFQQMRDAALGEALQQEDPRAAIQGLLRAKFSPAEAKTVLEGARAPEPRAPVRGSPEWLSGEDAFLGLQDKYKQRDDARKQRDDASKAAQPRPATEGERRAAGLLSVAERENGVMKELGTPGFMSRVAQDVPFGLGRAFMGDKARQFEASAQAFARSYLYTVSGANAPEGEVAGLAMQILPQPLDDANTITAKAERRAQMLEAMRTIGGRASQPAAAPAGTDTRATTTVPAVRPPLRANARKYIR